MRADGQTDGVKPIYPPTTSLFRGYNNDNKDNDNNNNDDIEKYRIYRIYTFKQDDGKSWHPKYW